MSENELPFVLSVKIVTECCAQDDGSLLILGVTSAGEQFEVELPGDIAKGLAASIMALAPDLSSRGFPLAVPVQSVKEIAVGTTSTPDECRMMIDIHPAGRLSFSMSAAIAKETGDDLVSAAEAARAQRSSSPKAN